MINEEKDSTIIENEISKQEEDDDDDNNSNIQTHYEKVIMSDGSDDLIAIEKKKFLNQELHPLQKGHQTRRIFVVGKNVAEFVLILKSKKLSITKERVVIGQCCIQFKGPVSTDLILRLLEESSLGLQIYSCKRAKGTFESFFSSSSFECHTNNKKSRSSSSSNEIPSISINNNELNHSYFTSSSASTERFMKALEQKHYSEELICLIKEQQLQQSQLLQQQLIHNEDERRVYDKILNVINENPLWRIPQVIEYFKQTGLEKITLIMHVIGKNKQILDNIISIYQEMNHHSNTNVNNENENENESESDDMITTSITQCYTQAEESQPGHHITAANKGIRKDLTESQLDKHKNRLLLLTKKSNKNSLKVNKKKKKKRN